MKIRNLFETVLLDVVFMLTTIIEALYFGYLWAKETVPLVVKDPMFKLIAVYLTLLAIVFYL